MVIDNSCLVGVMLTTNIAIYFIAEFTYILCEHSLCLFTDTNFSCLVFVVEYSPLSCYSLISIHSTSCQPPWYDQFMFNILRSYLQKVPHILCVIYTVMFLRFMMFMIDVWSQKSQKDLTLIMLASLQWNMYQSSFGSEREI